MSAGTLAFYSEPMDMVDAGIGRLLIASLHQGIADVSPTRLDFYENWLSPTGLRDGRMGLAPLGAVLSFLNREEPPADRVIPAHAGACAADWTYAGCLGVPQADHQAAAVVACAPTPRSVSAAPGDRDHQPVEGEDADEERRGRRRHPLAAVRVPARAVVGADAPLLCGRRTPSSSGSAMSMATIEVDAAGPCCRLTIAVQGSRAADRRRRMRHDDGVADGAGPLLALR